MKRVINGLMYDTEKAEKIAENSFSAPSDFHYFCETLYRTQAGRYFFTGEGGPMSHYAENIGNNTTSGSGRLWTINDAEAKEWLAKINPEKCEKIFGKFPEA